MHLFFAHLCIPIEIFTKKERFYVMLLNALLSFCACESNQKKCLCICVIGRAADFYPECSCPWCTNKKVPHMSAKTSAIYALCGTQEFIIVITFLYIFAINIHFDVFFFTIFVFAMQNTKIRVMVYDWKYCDSFDSRWNPLNCIRVSRNQSDFKN